MIKEISKIDKENLINYLLIKNKKNPLSRMYKITIKGIGCNAKCPMCDDWKNKGKIKEIRKGLYKAFNEILKEKIPKKMVYIFGGEPLLIFDDLINIIKIGKKHNIKIDFATNASLLTEYKVDKLIKSGLDRFDFSIDFPSIKHNQWRNLKDAYEKIIELTNYIQKKDLTVTWSTVVGKHNSKYLKNFNELYLISKPNIHDFIYIENNGGKSKNYFLEKSEKISVYNNLKKINNINIEIILSGFEDCYEKQNNNNKIKKCYIGTKNKMYYIDNYGNIFISPCYLKPYKMTDEYDSFLQNAIKKGCDLCSGSHKDTYNKYMENLIEKYIHDQKVNYLLDNH